MQLWAFQGLDAARELYESHGFALAHEALGRQWCSSVIGAVIYTVSTVLSKTRWAKHL